MVANVALVETGTDTWGDLITKLNIGLTVLNDQAITVGGFPATGNAEIIGKLTTNTLVTTTSISTVANTVTLDVTNQLTANTVTVNNPSLFKKTITVGGTGDIASKAGLALAKRTDGSNEQVKALNAGQNNYVGSIGWNANNDFTVASGDGSTDKLIVRTDGTLDVKGMIRGIANTTGGTANGNLVGISTEHGYTLIGQTTNSYSDFITSAPTYRFDKPLEVIGNIIPSANLTYNLGSSTKYYSNTFTRTLTANTIISSNSQVGTANVNNLTANNAVLNNATLVNIIGFTPESFAANNISGNSLTIHQNVSFPGNTNVIGSGAQGIILSDSSDANNSAKVFYKSAITTYTTGNFGGSWQIRSGATANVTSGNVIFTVSNTGAVTANSTISAPTASITNTVTANNVVASLEHKQHGGYFRIGSFNSSYGTGFARLWYNETGKQLTITDNAGAGVGISLGSTVASSPTNLTRHLSLYGLDYGFSVTGNQLNYKSGTNGSHQWYSGTNPTMTLDVNGGLSVYRLNQSGAVQSIGLNGGESNPYIAFYGSGDSTRTGYIQSFSSGTLRLRNDVNSNYIDISSSDPFYNGNRIWHAGNDGSGSGLDADRLDGKDSSAFNIPSTVVERNSSGYIFGTIFNQTYSSTNSNVQRIMTQNGSDGYIRPSTTGQVADALASDLVSQTGSNGTTVFPIGHTVIMGSNSHIARNQSTGIALVIGTTEYYHPNSGTGLAGTWKVRGRATGVGGWTYYYLVQRVA